MQNELSLSILRCPSVFSCVRATVMAASSARLIVCLSICDLMLICVMLCVRGFTTPAPSVLLPLTCEPSVYTNSLSFHFLLWGLVYNNVGVWCGWIGMGMSFVGRTVVYVGCI